MSTNKAKSRKVAITKKEKMSSADKIISEEPLVEEVENLSPNSEEPVEVDVKTKKGKARKQPAKRAKKLTENGDMEQDREEPPSELADEQEAPSEKKQAKKIGKNKGEIKKSERGKKVVEEQLPGEELDDAEDKPTSELAVEQEASSGKKQPKKVGKGKEKKTAKPIKKSGKGKKVDEEQAPVEEELDDNDEDTEDIPRKPVKQNKKSKKADNKKDEVEDTDQNVEEIKPTKKGKISDQEQIDKDEDQNVEEITKKVTKPIKKGKKATQAEKVPKKRAAAKEKKTNVKQLEEPSGEQDEEAYQPPKQTRGKTNKEAVTDDFLQTELENEKPPKKKAKKDGKKQEVEQVDVISTSTKDEEKPMKSKPKKLIK